VAFLQQLDRSDEVVMEAGHRYMIATKSGSLYIHGTDGVMFHGSTFGGSMIAPGRLIPGARLEFSQGGKVYTSSPIQAITVIDRP